MTRRPQDGALALVLHSHMPYVEGFGTWPFGEEWLWEAVACVYLPLLDVLDGAPVTVGLTPVLCDQLEAMRGDAGDRYLRFLRDIRAPIHAEDAAGLDDGGRAQPGGGGAPRRRRLHARGARPSRSAGRDLLGAFGALERVELWTSAATHALLPLMATDAGLRLQLATGTASHLRRFGELGRRLLAAGVRLRARAGARAGRPRRARFCVDQTPVAGLRPPRARWRPTPGPVAVPIDWETVELVWNDRERLPRARHLPQLLGPHASTTCKPWNNAGEPYDHEAALALAREHARDFVDAGAPSGSRTAACSAARSTPSCSATGGTRGRPGSAPCWRRREAQGVRLVTVSRGDRARGAGGARARTRRPGARAKDFVDLGRAAPWPSWPSRRAPRELRTVAAVAGHGAPHAALERAARELLAMQASDWAFMVTRDLAGGLPARADAPPRRRPWTLRLPL